MFSEWIDFSNPTSNQIQAAAVVVQTVVVGGALVFARWQLEAAREAREATDRPFVVIEFTTDDRESFVHLEIANHGRTAARAVRFDIHPELVSTLDDTGSGVKELSLIKDGIPLLGPGRRISLLFDTIRQRVSTGHGLPDRFEVTVSYDGEPNRRGKRRRYVDPMPLDIGIFRGRMKTTRHDVHDIHGELEKIRREVHSWTAPTGGLVTRTMAELQQESDEWAAEIRSQHREDAEETPPGDGEVSN